MNTIDNLMALAYKLRDAKRCEWDVSDAVAADKALRAALVEAQYTLTFYKRRVELLQEWQSKMRDPERTIACDIIANGQMMPEGGRYEVKALAAQPVREPLNKSEWPKHPSAYVNNEYMGYSKLDLDSYAMQVLAAHGIVGDK